MSGTTGTGKGLVLMNPTVEMLADVSAPIANNNDVLTYQAATGQWVAKAAGGSGGSQTPWTSDIDGATHSLSNVNSIGISIIHSSGYEGTGIIDIIGGTIFSPTTDDTVDIGTSSNGLHDLYFSNTIVGVGGSATQTNIENISTHQISNKTGTGQFYFDTGLMNMQVPIDFASTYGIQNLNSFNMPTGASNNYVLTSDGSGNGTWQPGGGGGSQDLNSVLGVGNDAGAQSITNLNSVTLANSGNLTVIGGSVQVLTSSFTNAAFGIAADQLFMQAGDILNAAGGNLLDTGYASHNFKIALGSGNDLEIIDRGSSGLINIGPGSGASAPTPQTLVALPLSTFGSGTISQLLGTPDAWLAIKSGGTSYKLPLYL